MNDIERALLLEVDDGPRGALRRTTATRYTSRLVPVEPGKSPGDSVAEPDAPAPSSALVRSSAVAVELPLERLAQNGYLTPATRKGDLTEQYRYIKRPLLDNIRKGTIPNANVVLVTSSIPGEGKTYTAINLAMSMALERDLSVLMIDADVINRSATGLLCGSYHGTGLIDLLENRSLDVADAILKTDVSALRVMTAGKSSDHGTELLSSQVMRTLMREVTQRYSDRLIVIDCAPMLAANEAGAMTDYAGQIVFVIDEGRTSQHDVDQALSRFERDRYVGLVMNKSRARKSSVYRYGYS